MAVDLKALRTAVQTTVETLIDPVKVEPHPKSIKEYAENRMTASGSVALLSIIDGDRGRVHEGQAGFTVYPVITILHKEFSSDHDAEPVLDMISALCNSLDGTKLIVGDELYVASVQGFSYVTRYDDVLRYGVIVECRPK